MAILLGPVTVKSDSGQAIRLTLSNPLYSGLQLVKNRPAARET